VVISISEEPEVAAKHICFHDVTQSARAEVAPETQSVEVVGLRMSVLKGGRGPALLVLHRDTGRGGWTPLHETLASSFTIYAPALPGFDDSSRPDWMRTVSELATVTGLAIDALRLGPMPILGLGFGGWVAVETAVQSPSRVSALVLHAPVGLQPAHGEILDQFLYSTVDYIKLGFANAVRVDQLYGEMPAEDILRSWDWNREMTTRLAWKPYMFNRALPNLLAAISTPTLVIRSGADRIVPPGIADRYTDLIPGSRLVELPGAGHQADLEHPAELAAIVKDFLLPI
jgi:pimeloyl-ACP methyl ester carboxylesterase